jgi:hypothetical protein
VRTGDCAYRSLCVQVAVHAGHCAYRSLCIQVTVHTGHITVVYRSVYVSLRHVLSQLANDHLFVYQATALWYHALPL